MSKPAIVNFVQSLIAVVVGNIVYFLLMPHLPLAARHNGTQLDWGIAVDFWFCLVALGLLKTVTKWGKRSSEQQR